MSETCPHCRRFREERDEALERLRQAEGEDGVDVEFDHVARIQRALRISPTSSRLVFTLWRAPGLVGWVRCAQKSLLNYDDILDPKQQLGVFVCRARKALPKGVKIETVWGVGYQMCAASKLALTQFLDEKAPA